MATQAEIIVREGARALGRYFLDPGEYVIGRDMSCDILLDGQGISRQHAQITVTPDRLLVRDLGGGNGTYVGGDVVEGSVSLPSGDAIRLGVNGSVEVHMIEGARVRSNASSRALQSAPAQSDDLGQAPPDAKAPTDSAAHSKRYTPGKVHRSNSVHTALVPGEIIEIDDHKIVVRFEFDGEEEEREYYWSSLRIPREKLSLRVGCLVEATTDLFVLSPEDETAVEDELDAIWSTGAKQAKQKDALVPVRITPEAQQEADRAHGEHQH
jgi:pSer/pThr/pTyr-binding forkhead associated (FHA) protein